MATNLAAGWLASRFGLAATLFGGLALQIGALVALAQLDPGWGVAASVAFVMAVQGVSGVAKDLAKMSSKSAVKLLARRTDPIITVYTIAAQLLAGVFYPLDVFPQPLQTVARFLPDTYAIAAMRRLLLPDSASLTGPSVNEALIVLVAFNVVLFPVAIWSFRRSLDFGRRVGVLGGY